MKGARMRNVLAATVGALGLLRSLAGTAAPGGGRLGWWGGTAAADDRGAELLTPATTADIGFAGAAADGSPAFVVTSEKLVSDDDDNANDVYAPSGGGYKLQTDRVQAGPDEDDFLGFHQVS